jgi:hypothetical protein
VKKEMIEIMCNLKTKNSSKKIKIRMNQHPWSHLISTEFSKKSPQQVLVLGYLG